MTLLSASGRSSNGLPFGFRPDDRKRGEAVRNDSGRSRSADRPPPFGTASPVPVPNGLPNGRNGLSLRILRNVQRAGLKCGGARHGGREAGSYVTPALSGITLASP